MRALLLILVTFIHKLAAIQVAPTWVTSPLAKADQFNVINTLTGNSATPTATMTFSSAFFAVPNIAYGIINYEGNDRMSQQCFEVNRTGITVSSFSVRVQIVGMTNIWLLTVRYIALDKAFPYHLNTFDNVPINYMKGAITNISVSKTTETYYTNTINYTAQAQASGCTFTSFTAPLANYKILLFMTTLYISGVLQNQGPLRPLNLAFTTTILSSATYMLNVSAKIECQITNLRLSIIIFDDIGIQASNLYMLVYQKIDMPTGGGFIAVPQQFIPNLIMGLIEYSTKSTKSSMHFNLKFQNSAGGGANAVYGIFMPESKPRNFDAFTRFGYTLFYMKTWTCPAMTYFNINTDLCESCAIANCQECQYINLCKTCNAGFFLVSTAAPNLQCTSCPLANCLTCASNTVCSVCDVANGFFLDPDTGLCSACSIPHCISCSSLTTCNTCDQPNSFFLNPSPTSVADQCIACSIAHCLQCSSLSSCSACDQASNYFASNAPVALSAAAFVAPAPTPVAPAPTPVTPMPVAVTVQCVLCTIPYCIQCANLNECTICDTNYVINQTDKTCSPCNVPNCLQCLNGIQCINCDSTANFFPNPDPASPTQCILCLVPDCLVCIDLSTCQTCNEDNNYFVNPSPMAGNLSDICILCTIQHCTLCSSLTTCGTCDQANGYFVNPAATGVGDQCMPCAIPNCIACSTLAICLTCNQASNYFLNPSPTSPADACIACTLPQCLQCTSLTACTTCDESAGFFLNSTDLQCYPCNLASMPNCLQCASLTSCLLCDASAGYYLNSGNGLCEIPPPRCGDNIFMSPQGCDDGNLDANDGCSPSCTAEPDFTCEPNPVVTIFNSVCYYMGQINLDIVYIEKVDSGNQIEILLALSPSYLSFWNTVDFPSMVALSNLVGFDSFTVNRNADGTVSILVNYSQDIQNTEITVQLDPTRSGNMALSRAAPMQRSFSVVPTDNEVAYAFNDDTYKMKQIVSSLAMAIAALSLFFFLLGIFARKLVGVQMMAVIQISYLSLLTFTSMNPCFKALTNIWFVNGLNYFSTLNKHHLRDPFSPVQVKGIFMYSRFLQNYNLTFLILIFLPLVISLVCYILSRTLCITQYRKKYYLEKICKVGACETVYQGVMFSGYVIAVGLALEFVYGIKDTAGFVGGVSIFQSVLLFVVYLVYFVLIIKLAQYFGEFVDFFKPQPQKQKEKEEKEEIAEQQKETKTSMVNSKWYNILMIERVLVGSCLVFLLQVEISPILTITIFLLLGIYTLVFRPYNKQIHNIRFSVNMLVCIIIQAIYLGYKKASFHDQNSLPVWFAMPILVCILLLLTVIYNAVILVYELVREWREDCPGLEKEEEINFQFMRERTMSGKNLNDPITIAGFTTSIAPSSPTNAATRKQLDEIRKQIKKDFSKKQNLLIKSIEIDTEGNMSPNQIAPKNRAGYFEIQAEKQQEREIGQDFGNGSLSKNKIRSANKDMRKKIGEGEVKDNDKSYILIDRYKEKVPEPERKFALESYNQI